MSAAISFKWYDYFTIVSTLVISSLIGIYYGFVTKKRTTDEYLSGGKKMKILPIGLSLVVSHISSIMIVSVPSELYRYGGTVSMYVCSHLVAAIFTILVVLPVLYDLKLVSIYEYLEQRFDSKTRLLCFYCYFISDFLTLPVFIYLPALAFATISGVNIFLVSLLLGGICIFYTAVGGFKTVIWTDIFQLAIMFIYFMIVSIAGSHFSGGFSTVFDTAVDGGRLGLDFDFDLTRRNTIWCFLIGKSFHFIIQSSLHQTGFQKYVAVPTYRGALYANLLSGLTAVVIFGFSIFTGLILYANYKDCDPLASKEIEKHDQLVPYYVYSIADRVPGLSGIFISGLFCASLSSLSSNLNSLSGVIYKDFVSSFLKKEFSEATVGSILKLNVVVVGVLGSLLTIIAHYMGDILTIPSLIIGTLSAPIAGVFILGFFFPRANSKGAFSGIIFGIILNSCLIVPSKYYQLKGWSKFSSKTLSTSGCSSINKTVTTNITNLIIQKDPIEDFLLNPLFRISFYYYPIIGAILTIVFGLVISYLTTEDGVVKEKLIHPICRRLLQRRSRKCKGQQYRSVENSVNNVVDNQ